MVTTRSKELGSALAAGEPVFTLIDPKSVWVLAYVDESKAGEIKVGQPAEIVLRSQPDQRVCGDASPASSRRAIASTRSAGSRSHSTRCRTNSTLGEQAEVYITTMQLQQPLLVPEAAIDRSQQESWNGLDGRGWTFAAARSDARPSAARRAL